MAGITCTIARQYRRYIQTNRGPLWFSVIEVEDTYSSSNTYYTGHYYETTGSSIISNVHKNELTSAWESVQTPFQSVDGKLVGTAFGSGQNSGIIITLDGVEIHRSETPYTDTRWNVDVGGNIVVFSDGYLGIVRGRPFVTNSFWRSEYPNNIVGHPTIYWNGPNSFGNWTDTTKDDSNVWTIFTGDAEYQMAAYFMGISREYGDPYEDGEYTDPEGEIGEGDGTWDLPQDDPASAGSPYGDLSAGLFRAYAMTETEVNAFSDQLWNLDVLDIISRHFQNPADLVMSLISYPFVVNSGPSETIGFNWISAWGLSSIHSTGNRISSAQEIQEIDFGYIDIDKYSGTFYDYQPYSSIQVHLPYIGFVPLRMSELVGIRIYIKYKVDVLTGDCTAEIRTNKDSEDIYHTKVVGYYQGNIGRPLPLTQQNVWQIYKKIGETAMAAIVAGTAASMGGSLAADAERMGGVADLVATKQPENAQTLRNTAEAMSAKSQSYYKTAKRFAVGGAANAIMNIGHANAPIVRNGSLDGSNGRTSSQECFAIISYPDQCVPDNQELLGYPSNIPGPLSKVSGYTEVREIRLRSSVATKDELVEIESIVRGGIII